MMLASIKWFPRPRSWIIAVAAALSIAGSAATARADVLRLTFKDEITPASADLVDSAISRAQAIHASALVIELDTPGGLDTAMRDIVSHILNSSVPVIVYVAPSGVRAASAGFIILESADVAAMAPGTVTGAAHPVMADGRDLEKTMAEKVTNDAAAYVRSLAEKRGRDIPTAESAVRESKSFTETEALKNHLIEFIANDESDLLRQADGRTVLGPAGTHRTLHVAGQREIDYSTSIRQRLLLWLADPRIAFLLFAVGALCIWFEFHHPGAIVPGTVGALSVILALYGFHMLPINLTGVLLIGLALVLFVLEVKFHSFGILGLGGIISATIGSLILIDAPNPELRLPPALVLSVVIPFALIMMMLMNLAIKARQAKVQTGGAGMIGLSGRAETPIFPTGTVFVRGELWRARSRNQIDRGEQVRIVGINGLTLEVEGQGERVPKETSAVDPGSTAGSPV